MVAFLTYVLHVEQARMMVSSDAARKLLAAPKRTIRTAKQTLENCQENLQTLGNLLQQTMAANLAVRGASVTSRLPSAEPDLVSLLVGASPMHLLFRRMAALHSTKQRSLSPTVPRGVLAHGTEGSFKAVMRYHDGRCGS